MPIYGETFGAFKTLVDEQRTLIRAKQQDRRLRACWNYDSDLTQLESDLLQRGLICWRYSLQSGKWKLGEGPNEDLRARFETLATRAGIELHPQHGIAPLDFWLHRVYLSLQQTRSRDFFRSDTGVFIQDVCNASATFCSRLEKRSITSKVSPVGQNIDRLRMDCGWSLAKLAERTGLEKKLIRSHVRNRVKPRPATLKMYAQAFSRELRRAITASDLGK